VEAPIWDCEGAAFLFDNQWPLVSSLQTTLFFWLDTHPECKNDQSWMNSFGIPILALEREIMLKSNAVRSISQAIASEIERAYGFIFDDKKIKVAPLGMSTKVPQVISIVKEHFEILFVGRLELRKGIDILLNSIPQVLNIVPNVQIRIIGDDSLRGPDGRTFKDKFINDYISKPWLENVHFEGRVSEEALLQAYADCDIFVAPSRFESFGLVFLEAMREGKPVIGCLAGGMPEVISNGINGLLIEPGNVNALTRAILQLVQDQQLRARMGEWSKKIFEEKFTSKRMAEESSKLYKLAKENFYILNQ